MQISGLSASNTFSATDVLAIEVNVNGVEKTYKLTGATLATALASIGSYLNTTDVVNDLTSTDPTKVLAAPQGKELNDNLILYIDNGHNKHIASSTDLNTVTTPGRYYISNNAPNAPFESYIDVFAYDSDYVKQVAYSVDRTNDKMAHRTKQNGTWGNWIYTSLGKVSNIQVYDEAFVPNSFNYSTSSGNVLGTARDCCVFTCYWSDSRYARQVAYSLDTEEIFIRRKANNVWGDWKKITPV